MGGDGYALEEGDMETLEYWNVLISDWVENCEGAQSKWFVVSEKPQVARD